LKKVNLNLEYIP